MDQITATRISALHSVEHPDRDYLIRKILRWYSKTFHTPLADVEELPLDDIMQAYYENRVEEMSPEERAEERALLLKTEEQRISEIMAEEAEEAELFEMGRLMAADEAKKKATKVKAKDQKSDEQIAPIQHQTPPLRLRDRDTELPSPAAITIPPNVEVKFIDEADLEAEIAAFEAMADGKAP